MLLCSTPVMAVDKNWAGGSGSWFTAGSWSPIGVPAAGDNVTIDANVTVQTDAGSDMVRFSTLTLGGVNSPTLRLTTGTFPGGHLIVKTNATFLQNSNYQLSLASVTVESGGTLTHSTNTAVRANVLNLKVAGDFTLQAGAQVNLEGKGYAGDNDYNAGLGPGGGIYSPGCNASSGGGHGGRGGDFVTACADVRNGGGSYDSLSDPTDHGSDGGRGGSIVSGNGGGTFLLKVAGALILNGLINVKGAGGTSDIQGFGGGAGGTVNINAATLAGTGTIVASGGGGGNAQFGVHGGGGGGGRIALVVTASNSSSLTMSAAPGTATLAGLYGGAGTIYTKNPGQAKFNLTIGASGVAAGTYTAIIPADLNGANGVDVLTLVNANLISTGGPVNFPTLSISGSTFTINDALTVSALSLTASTMTINATTTVNGNVTLPAGAVLTHSPNIATKKNFLKLTVNGDMTVAAGAWINVDGKGYAGGAPGVAGSGPGGGTRASGAEVGCGDGAGGGGGHGGTGGVGAGNAAPQNAPVNGSVTNPTDLGSGGGGGWHCGDTDTGFSGAGGGAFILSLSGTLTLNGRISANGSSGISGSVNPLPGGSGGGAGGTINLTVGTVTGSGVIVSSGGAGGFAPGKPTTYGGGGGGGRIAINATSCSPLASVTAGGGVGATSPNNGSAGTWSPEPTGLTGTPLGVSSITWTWSSCATNFIVYRATNNANLSGGVSGGSWTETNLSTNSPYGRRVSVAMGSLTSALSASATRYTAIERPTSVVFDAISTHSISAVAYAVAYSSLSLGQSGTTLTRDGLFPVSVAGSSVAIFSGLSPNASYYFTAKARNGDGVETPETLTLSTYTWAAVPSPAAPTAVTDSSVTANWDVNANPAWTQFFIQRATDAAFTVGLATQGWVTSSSATFGGLTFDTTYYFRVKARNAVFIETDYAVLPATRTLPATPLSAAPGPVSTTTITVNWNANGNLAGTQYLAERAADAGFTISVASASLVTLTSATFSGLSPATSYYFRVKARNVSGESLAAVLPATATWAAVPASAEPGAVTTTTLAVNWGLGGNPPGTEFSAECSTDASFATALVSMAYSSFTTAAFAGLTANTTYYTRVKARNMFGVETVYSVLPATATLAADPTSAAPGPISTTTITVNWGVNGNPAGTQFLAQRADDAGFTAALADSGWITLSSATFGGLAVNTSHYFRVKARSTRGVETAFVTLPATATWADVPASAEPGAVTTTTLVVNWGLGGNPTGTEFSAERSTDASFATGLAALAYSSATTASFISLTPNTTYYTRVRARSMFAVETAYTVLPATATLAADLLALAPGPVSTTTVVVNWDANGNPPGTQYLAERAADAGFTISLANAGWVTLTSATFSGLSPATSYYFHVKARSVRGVETAFTVLPATATWAAVPASAEPGAVTTTTLVVNWGAGGNPGGTEFSVERSSDASFATGLAVSAYGPATAASFLGLVPNTTYYTRVRARNMFGVETAYMVLPATATLAADPLSGSPGSITDVAMTLNWGANGNPSETDFLLEFSTAAGFAPLWTPVVVTTETSRAFTALLANATYYSRVAARNRRGVVTAATALPAAMTLIQGPTSGPAYGVFSTSVTARWGTGSNAPATEYRAQRSGSFDFSAIDEDSGWGAFNGAFTFVAGLQRDTTYYFRVKARDSALNETPAGASWTVLAATRTAVDGPGFQAADVFVTSVTARWLKGANPPATQYLAEISTVSSYAVLYASSDWQTNAGSFGLTGLGVNSPLYLRVRARNSSGLETPVTPLLSGVFTQAAEPGPPGFPYSRGGSNIVINWGAAGNPANTNFFAVRASSPDFSVGTASTGWITATSNNFLGLSITTTYYFRVKARNEDGLETAWTVLPATPTLFGPGVPSALAVSFADATSSDRLSVSWQDNAVDENSFELERSTDGSNWNFIKSLPDQPGTGLYTYLNGPPADPALAVNARYHYRVKAVNGIGESGYTNTVASFTRAQPASAGAPPLSSLTDSTVTANFSAGVNPAGTRYEVLASTGPLPNAFAGNVSSVTVAASAVMGGLTPNSTYYLTVSALNGDGVASLAANLGSTVTLAGVPVSPLVSGVGANALDLSWGTGVNPGGTPYLVEASTGVFPNGFSGNISSITVAASVRLQGLRSQTLYRLQVRALNRNAVPSLAAAAPDSTTLELPVSTPSLPVNGAFVRTVRPTFSWTAPSTTTVTEAGPGALYFLEVALNPALTSPVISISTPAMAVATGAYVSTTTLAEGTTHWWRVRLRDLGGGFSAWSSTYAMVVDASSPALSGFVSFNSTGGALGESQVGDTTSTVRARLSTQDLETGLAPFGGWTVRYSTSAGAVWTTVASTAVSAGSPYLALTGAPGSTGVETLSIFNMGLAQSTSAATGRLGTNLVEFTLADRAGNATTAGPFTVLVETGPPTAVMNPLTPLSTGSVRATAGASAGFMFPVQDYRLELSTAADFATLTAASPFLAVPDYSFAGLSEAAEYHARVVVRNSKLALSQPSAAVSTTTFGRVSVSTAALVFSGLQGVEAAVLRLGMSVTLGRTGFWRSLKVRETGTALDADFTAMQVYSDANSNGTFEAGTDIQVSQAPFIGGVATLDFSGNAQSVPDTGRNFFVVMKLSPLAAAGRGVSFSIDGNSDLGFAAPFAAEGPFPSVTLSTTVIDGPSVLNVVPTDLAPTAATVGQVNVPLARLRMTAPSGSSVLSSLSLRLAGTAPDTVVSGIRLYRDANGNGTFDGADALASVGSDAFSNRAATVAFTQDQSLRTVPNSGVGDFFVTANLSGAAVPGDTFGIELLGASELALATPQDTVTLSTFPFKTKLVSIVQFNNLGATFASMLPAQLVQGEDYAVLKATLSVNEGIAQVNRVSVNRIGTGVDSDVAAVKIYQNWDPVASGGTFNPGVDILLGTGSFTGGLAAVDISTLSLSAGSTNVVFVVFTVSPTAGLGNTLGASLSNAGYIRPVSTATTVMGAFPFASSTGAVVAVVNTLFPAAADVSPGGLIEGAADTALLKLTMRTDRNTVLWSGLNIVRTGAGTDGDVRRVRLYRDNDGNGLFDPALDVLLSAGADTFAGGLAGFGFASPEAVTTAPRDYFITAALNTSAQSGGQIGVRVSSAADFNINAPNAVSSGTVFPMTAGPISINHYPNIVSVATASIVPFGGASIGAVNVGLLKLTLNTDVSGANWQKLRVDRVGTLVDADVTAVKLYYDQNQLGVFDSANISQYLLVSSSAARFGNTGSVGVADVVLSTPVALGPTAKVFFIAVDLSTAAAPGTTLALRAVNGAYWTVDAPNTVAVGAAFQTPPMSIVAPPSQFSVEAVDLAPASVVQGTVQMPVMALRVWMDRFTGVWRSLNVARSGAGTDADVTRARLTFDSNANGALDPLIDELVSTAAFSGGQAVLAFAPRTVAVTTQTYFLTYDVSATAAAGGGVGASLGVPSVFNVDAPNNVSAAGFPLQSSVASLQATQSGVFLSVQDRAPASMLQGSTAQHLLTLTMNTTAQAVLMTGFTLRPLGTAAGADIARLRILKDDGDLLFKPGLDQELASTANPFLNGPATVNLSPSQSVGTTASRYFVAVDLAPGAVPGKTFAVSVDSAASFAVAAPNYVVNSGFPAASSLSTLTKRPDTMTVSVSPLLTSDVSQGARVAAAKILAWASADKVTLTAVRLQKLGSLADASLPRAAIYKDVDGSGSFEGTDLLVGSATFAGGDSLVSLSSAQTVGVTTAVYFVVLDIDVNASVGATLGIAMQDASYLTVPNPDSVSAPSLPFQTSVVSVLDAKTPTQPTVTMPDGTANGSFESITFVWTSTVALGSLSSVQYAVGTTAGGIDVVPFTAMSTEPGQVKLSGLILNSGTTYFVSVRAVSTFGFASPIGVSPAQLADFTVPGTPAIAVIVGASNVRLDWTPVSRGPSGIKGYLVEYRKAERPVWINAKTGQTSVLGLAAFRPAALGVAELVQPPFVVALPPGTVIVRVSGVSQAGVVGAASQEVKLQVGPLPVDGIGDVSSFPNPFDSRKRSANIVYTLSASAEVVVEIFDLFGKAVARKTYAAGVNGGLAGVNVVSWDGAADDGGKVSMGVYLCVIRSGGAKVIHKIGVIH